MFQTCHILGATGFIGSAIADVLERRLGEQRVFRWGSARCDLRDRAAVADAFRTRPEDDAYVFCAGIPRAHDDSADVAASNLGMLDNLLYALGDGPRQLVYISSVDVYGRPAHGVTVDERHGFAPSGPYADAAVRCEERLATKGAARPVTVLRLPGVYGPGDGQRSMVGTLAGRLLNDAVLALPRRPALLRDYITARDVGEITSQALMRRISGTFTVATGTSLSLRTIITMLADELSRPAHLEERGEATDRDFDLVFDVTALRAAFASVRMTPMEEGIRAYARWLRRDQGVNHA